VTGAISGILNASGSSALLSIGGNMTVNALDGMADYALQAAVSGKTVTPNSAIHAITQLCFQWMG